MTAPPVTLLQAGTRTHTSFDSRLAALLAFMAENGKRPNTKSRDHDERALACWFLRQRQRRDEGKLRPERAQMLDDAAKAWLQLPGPVPMVRAEGDFSGYARRVVAFSEKHDRLPGHTNPGEATDYQALKTVWRHYRLGTLSQAELKALRRIPGALKTTRKDPLPRLAELQAWCAKHGRLPRHTLRGKTSPDAATEAGLGQWMYRHVNRRHQPLETAETVHIRDSIIALQDTYPASGKVIEEVRAAAVVAFIEQNGRLPQVRREHELYEHAFAIRTRYRHGGAFRTATLRMLELTADLPDHLESQWDADLDRLAAFMDSHGRLPVVVWKPGRGRPTVEHQLAKWLTRETGVHATVTDPLRQSRLAALISRASLPVAA